MNKRMREITSQIEVLRNEAEVFYNNKDFDASEKKLAEIEDLNKEYAIAEKLFKEEKTIVDDKVVVQSKEEKKIANFVNGVKKVANSMSEGSNTDGGYTVPEDIQTDIEHLRESKESLQDLVSVEVVSTNSGRRTFKKRTQMTGFSEVGEGGKIGTKKTPQYSTMNYKIKKYAGIYPTTNELLEDSDANIYNELINWIADESRVTRNNIILETINKKEKTLLNGLDDIKKVLNVTLGQAFKPTSRIVTNDDGLQYLDTLKDSDGNYLLQKSPVDPMKLVLCAGATTIPVKVFANDTIPTAEGKIPMIIGDLKEGIKFFDRKKLNITNSNVAVVGSGNEAINAYEEDLNLFRAIEREDCQTRDDKAFVNGYISATEQEEPTA
jgi:HK97 family phage major capsid protein